MTLPTSLLSYQDCTELLDSAIADDFGIRYKVADYDEAMHEQSRIHMCRKLHREANKTIYEEGDPLYGRSIYDAIVVRIKNLDGKFFLYLERNDKVRGTIEPLSTLEPEPEPGPPLKISGVSRRV